MLLARSPSLFDLPLEIRHLIYDDYLNLEGVSTHQAYSDIRGGDRPLPEVYLSSEDVELKFWLPRALFQTSRQLREELQLFFLSTRCFSMDDPMILIRFATILGAEGRAAIRYLYITDLFARLVNVLP